MTSNETEALFGVASILSDCQNIESALRQLFKVVDRSLGMMHGSIVYSGDFSLTLEDQGFLPKFEIPPERVRQISEKVVQHGQFEFIELEVDEMEALEGRSGLTPHILSVPLVCGQVSLGALWVIKNYAKGESPAAHSPFLGTLALMITQTVLVHCAEQGQFGTNVTRSSGDFEASAAAKIKTKIRGNSKAIRVVFDHIGQVCKSDTTVLILGESGVGKELVAEAIHHNSTRSSKPFIKVNCAALPESLLESELFGHEKGAFTGAVAQKKGRFELAHTGTLFLDEIGDLSPATQVKLLRFLQERQFERVGGMGTLTSDVRILAATNRKLEEMIDSGDFRLDLYYRLNVFPIHVPPLKERRPDIVPLADHFVEKYNEKMVKQIRRITTPAIDLLMSYHWPGNVRELENCIERAVLLSTDDVIHSHHLPPSLQTAEARTRHQESLRATLDSVERELIADALKGAKGNMAKASRALGLTERVMGLRTKKYQIDPRKFKDS